MKFSAIRDMLPLPSHYQASKAGEVFRVSYQSLAIEAQQWAKMHQLRPANADAFRVALALVDMQNTFCIPGYELFVGGRSGAGAVDDSRRLSEFIYHNLGRISQVVVTMDTHQAMQVFHAIYLVNQQGEHPAPNTLISVDDIESGVWKFNQAIAAGIGISPEYGQNQLVHYARELKRQGKYDLTIWPYHAMLGGIGHAIVPLVEEAIFFHTIARQSQPLFLTKGDNPLTEFYSAIGPEVLADDQGKPIARKNNTLLDLVMEFDLVVIAGEAKSHCVAFTISDLLAEIQAQDSRLVEKVYLLDDCSTPVVIPGVLDYTVEAEAAYERFVKAGMHRVYSTTPMEAWG